MAENMTHDFTVYHFRHRDLIRLEKCLINATVEKSLKAHATHIVCAYRQFVSNKRIRNGEGFTNVWSDKAPHITFLMDNGWFTPVITLAANNALEVIKKTTSLNELWFLKSKVNLLSLPWRSTETLDILEFGGKQYLYLTGGFLDLNTLSFTTNN
jgi:hypothetical protein